MAYVGPEWKYDSTALTTSPSSWELADSVVGLTSATLCYRAAIALRSGLDTGSFFGTTIKIYCATLKTTPRPLSVSRRAINNALARTHTAFGVVTHTHGALPVHAFIHLATSTSTEPATKTCAAPQRSCPPLLDHVPSRLVLGD